MSSLCRRLRTLRVAALRNIRFYITVGNEVMGLRPFGLATASLAVDETSTAATTAIALIQRTCVLGSAAQSCFCAKCRVLSAGHYRPVLIRT